MKIEVTAETKCNGKSCLTCSTPESGKCRTCVGDCETKNCTGCRWSQRSSIEGV